MLPYLVWVEEAALELEALGLRHSIFDMSLSLSDIFVSDFPGWATRCAPVMILVSGAPVKCRFALLTCIPGLKLTTIQVMSCPFTAYNRCSSFCSPVDIHGQCPSDTLKGSKGHKPRSSLENCIENPVSVNISACSEGVWSMAILQQALFLRFGFDGLEWKKDYLEALLDAVMEVHAQGKAGRWLPSPPSWRTAADAWKAVAGAGQQLPASAAGAGVPPTGTAAGVAPAHEAGGPSAGAAAGAAQSSGVADDRTVLREGAASTAPATVPGVTAGDGVVPLCSPAGSVGAESEAAAASSVATVSTDPPFSRPTATPGQVRPDYVKDKAFGGGSPLNSSRLERRPLRLKQPPATEAADGTDTAGGAAGDGDGASGFGVLDMDKPVSSETKARVLEEVLVLLLSSESTRNDVMHWLLQNSLTRIAESVCGGEHLWTLRGPVQC